MAVTGLSGLMPGVIVIVAPGFPSADEFFHLILVDMKSCFQSKRAALELC